MKGKKEGKGKRMGKSREGKDRERGEIVKEKGKGRRGKETRSRHKSRFSPNFHLCGAPVPTPSRSVGPWYTLPRQISS